MNTLSSSSYRRLGFASACFALFLLFWANGAVGLIGSEDNPANLLYASVFGVAILGAFLVRFSSHGMVRVLIATGIVHICVPLFALFVWPAKASWGSAGVIGVLVLNTLFSASYFFSAYVFNKADETKKPTS
jgi:hypothetical protein